METFEILKYEQVKKDLSFSYKTINFNGIDIRVYQYMSARDMLDLINSVMQKSREEGYFNPFKVDIYTHLNILYLMTDIVFQDEDRSDELALYDEVETSGLLQAVIEKLPQKYYTELLSFVEENLKRAQAYASTTAAVINALANQLPQSAEAAMNFVNSFDPDKYEAVKRFAEAANGNRDIVTNLPVETAPKKKPVIIKK